MKAACPARCGIDAQAQRLCSRFVNSLSQHYLLVHVKPQAFCMFSVISVQLLIVAWALVKNTVIQGNDSCLGTKRERKARVYWRTGPQKHSRTPAARSLPRWTVETCSFPSALSMCSGRSSQSTLHDQSRRPGPPPAKQVLQRPGEAGTSPWLFSCTSYRSLLGLDPGAQP